MKQRLLFSALMSFVLSFLMSCWVTWINLGLSAMFIERWLNAFILAWPAAAAVSFLFGPIVQQLTLRILLMRRSEFQR
ncbi:DUF2798 domain-containing protein [Kiloniella laminariae]|uniref:DUF2798 domain-containing protein n=1 Tax=Kiloniella laminariae TaxID=454162 RepID=UPI000371E7F0|nr:DUF2798 domain-containing protein [Kiloniella laminariae]